MRASRQSRATATLLAESSRGAILQTRFRMLHGGVVAIGPGKIELLEGIQEFGSISEAARKMGISYMRAWSMIRVMNQVFREPLVETDRGGKARGGTRLTQSGAMILAIYREMEEVSLKATRTQWRRLKSLLRRR